MKVAIATVDDKQTSRGNKSIHKLSARRRGGPPWLQISREQSRLSQLGHAKDDDLPAALLALKNVRRANPRVAHAEAALHGDNMGQATLGWIAGCLTIWSSLFAIGNFLYGRTQTALLLTAVFVVSGSVLLYVVNRLWDRNGARKLSARAVPPDKCDASP